MGNGHSAVTETKQEIETLKVGWEMELAGGGLREVQSKQRHAAADMNASHLACAILGSEVAERCVAVAVGRGGPPPMPFHVTVACHIITYTIRECLLMLHSAGH
jgi:hypothetical protein